MVQDGVSNIQILQVNWQIFHNFRDLQPWTWGVVTTQTITFERAHRGSYGCSHDTGYIGRLDRGRGIIIITSYSLLPSRIPAWSVRLFFPWSHTVHKIWPGGLNWRLGGRPAPYHKPGTETILTDFLSNCFFILYWDAARALRATSLWISFFFFHVWLRASPFQQRKWTNHILIFTWLCMSHNTGRKQG